MKVKLNAVAALLRRNDLTKLELVEKTLLQVSSGADPSSIGALLSSLEEIRDSKAIPTLTRLQSSNSANVRRSATYALRRIGTTVVLRPLMKALYDTDREVRYQAVIGLAVITEQYSWGPSIDGFQSNEQRYLTHWREWAKNH